MIETRPRTLRQYFQPGGIAGILLLVAGLHLTTRYSYLLFHTLAEFFSIAIAATIFIIAINCWKSIENAYLLVVGVSYLFVGAIDILHTLSYTGMPIFTDYEYYAPQFWIAARFMESLSMLAAFAFLGTERKPDKFFLLFFYFSITALLVSSILYFKVFPACFVPGTGLTPFKKVSEYLIALIFLLNIVVLKSRKRYFTEGTYRLIRWSIILMIAMELCFTLYVKDTMSDAVNELGHIFKILAFYFVYRAIVVTGLTDPINLLFRDLKTSEERLLEAQHLAKMGSWEKHLEGWKWSNEMYSILGVPASTRPSLFLIEEKLDPSARESLEQALDSLEEESEFFELRLTLPDPHGAKHVHMRGRVVRNEEETFFAGTLQDVTDEFLLQRAEEIAKDKEKYELLMQTSGDGIHLVDENGNVVEANYRFCEMLGYSRTEMLKMNVTQWDASLCAEEVRKKIEELSREPAIFETRHRRRDGTVIDVEISAKAITYGDRTVLWNASRDITARKTSEEELRKLSKAVEQSPSSIIITDPEANISYVNDAFVKRTGYSLSEVMGKNPSILRSGKTPESIYEELWHNLKNGATWHGEFINKAKDEHEFIEAAIISPVRDAEGRVISYLGIQDDITERKQYEERMAYLAHFDQLTGLPNRTLLRDHFRYALSLAQRNAEHLVVMFLDLDHFKKINDTLGHSIGDRLLMETARQLKSVIREVDTVSRLGGDEFILILPGTDVKGAARIAKKVLDVISSPFLIEGYELVATASIGIAMYPEDGSDMEVLSQNADAAMYQAKQDGRNGFRFFTSEMQANSLRNLKLGNDLRQALARSELYLHYQPQFGIQDGKLCGAEALLRWNHPEFGPISPAEFIPIAEDSGLIIPIGEWVLKTACLQMKKWLEQKRPIRSIAVNLSAIQFRHPGLTASVMEIVEEIALPTEYLELELTEAAAMDNPKEAISIMDELHAHGIRMSIDDFGTGYSSLSYLKKFKVNKLKIDQSFVRDISSDQEDRAIVSAIIHLARNLGLRTIAEGVETPEQLEFLKEKGCDEVQGYLFGKPLPVEEFEKLMNGALA